MSAELQNQLAQAQSLLQSGRLQECAGLCQSMIQSKPRLVEAHLLLAQALQRGSQVQPAMQVYERALSLAPKRPDLLLAFAGFLRAAGRVQKAEKLLRKLVKLAPDLAPGWHALAMLLYRDGRFAEAERRVGKRTKLEPTNPAGWELAAAIAQSAGSPQRAIALCERGLSHSPDAPRLHYSLAQLYRQETRFEESAAAYKKAQELGFVTADLFRNRAEALLESGELEAALDCGREGVQQFPGHAVLQRTTARLHHEAGADGDPMLPLVDAAHADPANADLWQTMVELLKRLERKDEAAEALVRARKLGCPDTPGIEVLEAQALADAGDDVAANARFESLLKKYPESSCLMHNFAMQLLSSNDPQRADTVCEQALALDPFDQLALCYRGTAWQLLGDPREAWLLDYEKMVVPVEVPVPEGFADRDVFFAELRQVLEELHHTNAQPIEQSVRGGTQTNGFLFRLKHPLLVTLERQIRAAIVTALETFPDVPDHPFWGRRAAQPNGDGLRFAGAWSVRLKDQGFHANHIHPEGWVSSALYISLPPEVQAGTNTQGHIQFGSPMTQLGLELAPKRTVKPSVGTLVLFPSYMWHGTLPFRSDEPRITVAFDLLPQT
ncbi:MAG: putative 2OG-Fe(II) oxygenase [Congregibacter sp.]